MWRHFSAGVEEFAAICFSRVETDELLQVLPGVERGSKCARRVLLASRRAYAKPAMAVERYEQAVAREKIAADLGYALGLPTSAVLIARPAKDVGDGLPPIVALSFPTFEQGAKEAAIDPAISLAEREQLRPVLSAIYTFHAWIDDRDHRWGWNHWFERQADGQVRTAYFDYDQSLNDEWRPPNKAPSRKWAPATSAFAPLDGPLDEIAARTVIERIGDLCDVGLNAVLKRIPDDCMSALDRDALMCGLIDRAKDLESILMVG